MPQIDVEKLEEYADMIYRRANYFNDYTLETIGGRLKEFRSLSAYDQQTLKNMTDISGDMETITKKLAEITELNISDIQSVYEQAMNEGVKSYEPLFDFKSLPFVPYSENEYAQQLVKHWATQTAGEMINLSRTKALCFVEHNLKGDVIKVTSLQGAFQKAMDDAVIAVSTGTSDINTVIRKTVETLGGSGVRVNYGSGVTRRLDTMVRQNMLYGAKKAALAYDEYIEDKLGCDGFEIDYHPHPRPSHAFMGGGIFSYDGDRVVNGIRYPDGAEALERLNDYGCLHIKTGVLLGISEPRYDKAWLEEQKQQDKELVEYNGVKKTRYEWKQAQRRLEVKVKQEQDTATMAKAAGDNSRVWQAEDKLEIIRAKYDDLCEKTGLQPTLERMAVYDKKRLTTSGGGGIIEKDIQIGRSLGAAAFRDSIMLPNGQKGKIQEGSKITKVVTFAGKGTNKELRVAKYLAKQYNIPESEWKHSRGDGYVVCDDGVVRHAELHWFESSRTGRIKMKVKRYFKDES